MATHYETLKAAFKERVLPHFPEAGRRFKKHFRESYGILRMPEAGSKLNLAFTLLGLKPLSHVEHWYPSEALTRMLMEAGLQINAHPKPYRDPGTEVYDPELAAEPLSKMLGRTVSPENAAQAVKEAFYTYDHSHELLGYPQPYPWLSIWNLAYANRAYLNVRNISQDYRSDDLTGSMTASFISEFGCVITDTGPVVKMLPAYAAAAAIVADIMEAPIDIITEAQVTTHSIFLSIWGREKAKTSVTIGRTSTPAEWITEERAE